MSSDYWRVSVDDHNSELLISNLISWPMERISKTMCLAAMMLAGMAQSTTALAGDDGTACGLDDVFG